VADGARLCPGVATEPCTVAEVAADDCVEAVAAKACLEAAEDGD
jgi:hypothetical protein